MPGSRSITTLALAAVLGGACSPAPSPLATPATSPSDSLTPASPVALASPTTESSPGSTYLPPPSGCPTLEDAYRAPEIDLEFLLSVGFARPHTTAVSWVTGQPAFVPRRLEFRGDGGGVLPGGRALPVELRVFYVEDRELEPTFQMDTLRMTLLPSHGDGVRLTTLLTVSEHGWPRFLVEGVPDIDSLATLDVTIDWHDACFSYTAEVSMHARIDSTVTVGDCALDRDAAFDQLDALFDAPMQFGSRDTDVAPAYGTSRYADTGFADGPYGIAMFDRSAPTQSAAPGERIVFRATNPDLVLQVPEDPVISFYRRAAVNRHIEAGGVTQGAPDPLEVARSRLVSLGDGRFRITAPLAPGRYVASIEMPYTSTCSEGRAVAGPGVDVVSAD